MKMKMMCFLLLLLLCSLSAAQLQEDSDNEVFFGKPTEPQKNQQKYALDGQQTCTMDLHAVLREMSASLAEQRVEIRHLQTQNEAQAAKLELQKAELDKQKTELDKQKTELDKLNQKFQVQAAELITVKTRSNVTENQVEALLRYGEVRQVAFSASLLASGEGHTGPFDTQTLLVFRHVIANIGNAYNPNTGFFIAPVRGAYHFEIYIGAHAEDPPRATGAVLMKNGAGVCTAFERQETLYASTSNGATLLLEVGDVVFVYLWQNTRMYDNDDHHSTFSGHLLFPM